MADVTCGTRVVLKHAGHTGTVKAVLPGGLKVLVQWDNGLFGPAWLYELEVL